MADKILIEDVDIYDGWIAEYDPETKKVTLRDFWVTERMSKERKKELIESYTKMMNDGR